MELADDPIDINIGLSQSEAGYAATRYLIDLGHRRIGNIAAPARRALAAAASRLSTGHGGGRPRHGGAGRHDEAPVERQRSARELFARYSSNAARSRSGVLLQRRPGARRPVRMPSPRHLACPTGFRIIGFNDLEFCASAFPVADLGRDAALRDGRNGGGDRARNHSRLGRAAERARIDLGFAIVPRASTSHRAAGGSVPRVG